MSTTPARPSGHPTTGSLLRRGFADTVRAVRSSWVQLALVVLLTGLATLAALGVLAAVGVPAVRSLGPSLLTDGVLDPAWALLLGFLAGALLLVTCLPLALLGFTTAISLVDTRLAGDRPELRGALRGQRRRLPRVLALVVGALVVVPLLVVAFALLSVVGLVGLVLTPLVRALGRRWAPATRWPAVRTLVVLAVPLAPALLAVGVALLAVPAAALDAPTLRSALRRADLAARGQRALVVLGALVSLLAVVVVQAALSLLGSTVGTWGAGIGQVVGPLIALGLPVVVLTVLYRLGGGRGPDGSLPPHPTAPYGVGIAAVPPRRERTLAQLSVSARLGRRLGGLLAASLVAGLLVPGVAQAQTTDPTTPPTSSSEAPSETPGSETPPSETPSETPPSETPGGETPPSEGGEGEGGGEGGGLGPTGPGSQTLTVTTGSDSTTDVDGQAASCAANASCTLRGALAAASTSARGGQVGAITIRFAGPTTVAASGRLVFNPDAPGVGEQPAATPTGRLTIDGGGQAVVVSGAGLDLFSRGFDATVRGLRITGATAGNGGLGGGLYLSGRGGSLVDSVTLDHNTAIAGGGLVAGGALSIVNSTFSDNAADSSSSVGDFGGADVYATYQPVDIQSSTFAGATGPSLSAAAAAITVTGSLFQPRPGPFACASQFITGSGNVASAGTQCPGTTTTGVPLVGPLTTTALGALPVLPLLVGGTPNPARGAAGSNCPAVDARGVSRVPGPCDAGAVQLNPATSVGLTSSANPADAGDPVVVTATVTAAEGIDVPGGTVQLLLDGAPSGSPVPLTQGGTVALTLPTLPVGDTRVTVTYAPRSAGALDPSTSPVLVQTVRGITPTVVLAATPNPSVAGAPVDLTAQVQVGGAALTRSGTVTITDVTGGGAGTVVAADLPVGADGFARTTTSALLGGARTLVARYSGDGAIAATSSAPFVQRVQATSSLTLILAPSPTVVGTPVRATVTVPTTIAGTVPTGGVVLSGPTSQQRVTLGSTGTATLDLTDLPAGAQTVTAQYDGDASYTASSTTAQVTVTPAATSTSLTAAPAGPVDFGAPVTLTATVRTTSAGSTATPAGTVAFTLGATALGTATLVAAGSGTATATITTTAGQLPVGTATVTATLAPTADFTAGTAATTAVEVRATATTTTLTTDTTPADYGTTVTLRATVAPGAGTAVPAGTVTFRDGAAVLGTGTLVAGVATLGTASLAVGGHTITATYAGDGSTGGSTSAPLTQVVTAAATTTTLTAPATAAYGAPVALRVVVAPASGRGTTPAGTVVVTDGATTVATLALVDGAATGTAALLAAGPRTLRAAFTPADGYLPSTGTADVTVTDAATSTVLTADTASTVVGEPVTLTATVTSAAGSSAAPAGTVTFRTPFAALATVAVTAGTLTTSSATVTAGLPESSAFPRGLPLTADFTPATGFGASSGALELPVAQGTTAVSLAASGPTNAGILTTLTATVTVLTGRGTPTGTVVFLVGGQSVGSAPLGADGTATVAARLDQGLRSVQAVYTSGDRSFLAGDPASISVAVGVGTVPVVLTSSATGPIAFGTPTTLTATLGAPAPGVVLRGTVTFTATGPQGTTTLGTAQLQGDRTATLLTTTIPVGTQALRAAWSGDGVVFAPVTSDPVTQVVTDAGTTTTVTADPQPAYVGVPLTATARVSAPGASPVPAGTVSFTLAGQPVGSAPLGSTGSASVQVTPVSEGTSDLVATFTPAGGFAGSTGTVALPTTRQPVTVQVLTDGDAPAVGQSVVLRARVFAVPRLDLDPSGTVVLTGAGGQPLCTVGLSGVPGQLSGSDGTCVAAFPGTDGSVTATYSGDRFFAPATGTGSVAVQTRTPALRLDLPSRWVTGDPGTLAFSVRGPTTTDGTVTVLAGGVTVCTSQALTGTCTYTFASGAAAQTFELRYSGSLGWAPARTSVDGTTPLECVRLTTAVNPAGAGTVAVQGTPDCNSGAGYVAGDSVRLTQTPSAGYTFTGWDRGTAFGPFQDVVVGPGPRTVVTASYTDTCIPVTLRLDSPVGGAGITRSTAPNCGSYPREWRGQDNAGTVTGLFTRGTALSLTPTPATQPNGQPLPVPQSFYTWRGQGLPDGGAFASPLALTLDTGTTYDLTAVFGTTCYQGISFPTPDGGTAVLGAPNCSSPRGAGYAAGSRVPVSTRPTGDAYFDRWTSPVTGEQRTAGGSDAVVVARSDGQTVTAQYSSCVRLDVRVAGTSPVDGSPLGRVDQSSTGNCPSQGAGWFVRGSQVSLSAEKIFYGPSDVVFGGWTSTGALPASATNPSQSVTLDADTTVTATWYDPFYCRAITLTSVPAGALDLRADVPGGTGSCPPGYYDRTVQGNGDTTISLTATPAAGDPGVAWTGTFGRLTIDGTLAPSSVRVGGRTVAVPVSGDAAFTAYACQAVAGTVTLVSPTGTRRTGPPPTDQDYIAANPAPDCPTGGSSYVIGQNAYLSAGADPAGYTFQGWSGALSGDDAFPTTPLRLDGATPSVAVGATYQVVCHELTSNFDNVTLDPAPNCPDAAPGSHSYVGGTAVTLQRTSDGDAVFRGWTGSPETTFGDYATVTMASDVAVYANFTAKTTGEKAGEFFSSVGDGMAVAGKKALGVVSAMVGAALLGSNPLTVAAGAFVLVMQGFTKAMHAIGIKGKVLDGMGQAATDVGAFLTFVTSSTSCTTNWASGTGGTDADAASKTELGKAGAKLTEKVTEAVTAAEKARAAAQAAQTASMRADVQFLRSNSVPASSVQTGATATAAPSTLGKWAGRIGPAVTVGTTLYAMSKDGGWDANATDAWTTGGDQFARCMALAVPDYFGLPPVPDDYPSGSSG